jgi:predicted ATPase
MFNSLHIQGFRAFEDLQLKGLGRVNLLVGKNNVGKTTVLEAIKIRCAGTGAVWELRRLLDARQEVEREQPADGEPQLPWNLPRIFHCESNNTTKSSQRRLSIGPIDVPENTLTLALGWTRVIRDDTGEIPRRVIEEMPGPGDEQDVSEAVILSFGDGSRRIYTPERIFRFRPSRPGMSESDIGIINCHYLPARGFTENEAGELWDSVVLTDLESDVLAALQIIAPEIERISLIESKMRRGERLALIRRAGRQTPEPLKSMGDGMNRIFEMALGLANSKSGIFLVDEIENGVHYSVQEELWSFIFQVSSRLQSQVFATTHSWDCIEAFQKAASSHPDEGTLVRLYQQEQEISAYTFDEHRLEILTRESIEVR